MDGVVASGPTVAIIYCNSLFHFAWFQNRQESVTMAQFES